MELSSDEVRLIQGRRAARAMTPPRISLSSGEAMRDWMGCVLDDLRAEVSGIAGSGTLILRVDVIAIIDRRLEALDGR